MKPIDPRIQKLIDAALDTRQDEISCDEWLENVAPLAERIARGEPIPEALQSVAGHLEYCRECSEEFDALLEALKG